MHDSSGVGRAETPAREDEANTRTRRKVLAVLAGGLVLGVGAAITLAAWNDSEFAQGTFAAGTFDLVGSTDGSTFASHPSSGPASLTFALDASRLAPDEPVYAAFAVQLTAASTDAASVSVSASSAAPIASALTYSIVSTTTFGCDAAAFQAGTSIGVVDQSATASSIADAFALTAAATPVNLCIEVVPGTSLASGTASGAVVWEFEADSTGAL